MSKEKELRKNIEAQVAHEKRAYKNVEKTVLSDSVVKDELEDVVNEIMPGHYADIIEERSIAKLCGYPLCPNKLTKVPRQNFHISVERRKVYDITERKCFCSSKCYKASKYIESQIPASPLWLREERVKLHFFEDTSDEAVGEQTVSIDDKIHQSEHTDNNLLKDKIESSAESEANLSSKSRISTNPTSSKTESPKLESPKTASSATTMCRTKLIELPTKSIETNRDIDVDKTEFPKIKSPKTASSATTICRTKLIELPVRSIETSKDIDVDKLCNLLEEWCTVNTYKLLQQKKKGTKVAEQPGNPSSTYEEESASPEIVERSAAKKFLKDNCEWNSEIASGGNFHERALVSKAFVSPLVDSRSQDSIRRKIVAQKLNHSLCEVFSDLYMSIADFTKLDLASLIKTFRFTSQNISLKPKEWKLIATALLHTLSSEDEELAATIERRSKEMQDIFDNCGVEKDKFAKLLEILKKFDKSEETTFDEISSEHACEYDNDSLD